MMRTKCILLLLLLLPLKSISADQDTEKKIGLKSGGVTYIIDKHLALLSKVIKKAFNELLLTNQTQIILPTIQQDIMREIVRDLKVVNQLVSSKIDYRGLRNYLFKLNDKSPSFWGTTDKEAHKVTRIAANLVKRMPKKEILALLNQGKDPADMKQELVYELLTEQELEKIIHIPLLFQALVRNANPIIAPHLVTYFSKKFAQQKISVQDLLKAVVILDIPALAIPLAYYISNHVDLRNLSLDEQTGLRSFGLPLPASLQTIINHGFIIKQTDAFFPITLETNSALSFKDHHCNIQHAIFIDNNRIITFGNDCIINVWDTTQETPIVTMVHEKSAKAVALNNWGLSKDKSLLMTAYSDNGTKTWHLPSGKNLFSSNSSEAILCNNNQIAIEDTTYTDILNARTGEQYYRLEGKFPAANHAGTQVATSVWRVNKTWIWDLATGNQKLRIDDILKHFTASPFSPDDSMIATLQDNQILNINNVQTGNVMHSLTLDTTDIPFILQHFMYSPDSKKVAISFLVGKDTRTATRVLTWNLEYNRRLDILPGGSVEAFDNNSTRLLTSTANNDGRIIYLEKIKEPKILHGHTAPITDGKFNPRGDLVVTTSLDKTAKIWHAKSGTLLYTCNHPTSVESIEFSPNGKSFITVAGKVAYYWPLSTYDVRKILNLEQAIFTLMLFYNDPALQTMTKENIDRIASSFSPTAQKLVLDKYRAAIEKLIQK